MKFLKSHTIAVDQGSALLFSDFENGGVMWSGEGAREIRKKIKFQHPFDSPPSVHLSMSMWDIDQRSNPRADIRTDKITNSDFIIQFRTWGDTRIARVRADWLAIGEMHNDDEWDVE